MYVIDKDLPGRKTHMQMPGKLALICWFVSFAIIVGALFLALGAPASSDGASEAIGRVFAHTGICALATWLLARKKSPSWSRSKFALIYVAALIVFGLITSVGRSGHAAEVAMPFVTTYPAGWTVERLQGVSSAPQDKDRGVREIARWEGADGSAVIAVSCSWLMQPAPHLDALLKEVLDGYHRALEGQDLALDVGASKSMRIGGRDALMMDVRALKEDKPIFNQKIAVTLTEECVISATFAGTSKAFDQQADTFASFLNGIRFR